MKTYHVTINIILPAGKGTLSREMEAENACAAFLVCLESWKVGISGAEVLTATVTEMPPR